MSDDNYLNKIKNFIFEFEKNKKNLNILEFGVREGRSTKMFLELCSLNNGKLISVDVDDYSNLFNDKNWTFVKSRDDEFINDKHYFQKKFNIILIDSLHEPLHVSKLIYMYWEYLSVDGSMYIDDISWLPYTKDNWRDHKYTENINRDTFNEILSIKNSNWSNIDLVFDFNGSGLCRIIKKNDLYLIKKKKVINRNQVINKIFKNLFYKSRK